jgi:diguanylate cyclase (GGDEF)-like protein
MNGAIFFLAVNFVVALCFSAVFAVVSTRSRSRKAALWFAAGFAVASLSAVCEILVAYAGLPKPWALGAFATVLAGMILLRAGMGELYGPRTNWKIAVVFLIAGMGVSYLIYDLPRGTPLQAFSYQTPFALVMLMSAFTVLSSRRRLVVDRFLGILLVVVGCHFFAKAGLAVLVGSGSTAKDYIHTDYALISQSATAILMVAVGLTLLSVLVLEIMADQRSESERDMLSGLANRRGFERHIKVAMAGAPKGQHAVILCDLDHFKSINDTYGHNAGDMVIQGFGELLRSCAPKGAAVGRIGGEEFAVFLPDTVMESAMLFAQALRGGTMTMAVSGLPASLAVTASFGVAWLASTADLPEAFRQADMALYEAKHAGRNCVKQAGNPVQTRATHLRPVK